MTWVLHNRLRPYFTVVALWCLVPLAACSSTPKPDSEPVVKIVKVNKAIAGACVPSNLEPRPGSIDPVTGLTVPDYADTDAALKAAPDGATRYQLLFAGRDQRNHRLEALEVLPVKCPKEKASGQ